MNEDPNFVEGQMHDPQPEATPASETPKSKPAESGATLKAPGNRLRILVKRWGRRCKAAATW